MSFHERFNTAVQHDASRRAANGAGTTKDAQALNTALCSMAKEYIFVRCLLKEALKAGMRIEVLAAKIPRNGPTSPEELALLCELEKERIEDARIKAPAVA